MTEPVRAFATLRVTGDDLAPDEVTKILKIVPTTAYAKGEHYAAGFRSPDLVGRTGVWFFSTKGVVAGNQLADHLAFLARLLLPGSGEAGPLPRLQPLLRRRSLRVAVSGFWHGPVGARQPSIPRSVTDLLKLIPAEIETDFDVDERPRRRRRSEAGDAIIGQANPIRNFAAPGLFANHRISISCASQYLIA
jgi:hypothetical protein